MLSNTTRKKVVGREILLRDWLGITSLVVSNCSHLLHLLDCISLSYFPFHYNYYIITFIIILF